jgi:hypothetical protein
VDASRWVDRGNQTPRDLDLGTAYVVARGSNNAIQIGWFDYVGVNKKVLAHTKMGQLLNDN